MDGEWKGDEKHSSQKESMKLRKGRRREMVADMTA